MFKLPDDGLLQSTINAAFLLLNADHVTFSGPLALTPLLVMLLLYEHVD